MDPYNSADSQWAAVPPPVPTATPANPYAAPHARLAEAHNDGELVLASRLTRLGAVMLDGAVLAVPAIVLAVALPAMKSDGGSAGMSVLLGLFGLGAIGYVIFQLILLHRHGQTLGKKLLGIRIVRQDGSRAGLGRIFALRMLVPGIIGAIPLIGSLFSLADSLFIFGSDKRCLHDMIADTIVVDA